MQFEYIYLKAVSLNEFMAKLNEYGEEGYRFVPQSEFGIFLFERQVYPEVLSFSSAVKPARPIIPDHVVFMLLMSVLTLIFVLAVVARVFRWV